MSAFRAGVLTVKNLVAAYFGFTKSNPFADPYELRAVVRDAQNLKPGAPVREAGGGGQGLEARGGRRSRARTKITMELSEDAPPVHEDARVQIRPRILLEGNFFVDLEPGLSQAEALEDGGTVPITQTSSAVTLPEVLSVLDSDTRSDLQTLLREYATAVTAAARGRSTVRFRPSRLPTERADQRTRCSASSRPRTCTACCATRRACSGRCPRTRRRSRTSSPTSTPRRSDRQPGPGAGGGAGAARHPARATRRWAS